MKNLHWVLGPIVLQLYSGVQGDIIPNRSGFQTRHVDLRQRRETTTVDKVEVSFS